MRRPRGAPAAHHSPHARPRDWPCSHAQQVPVALHGPRLALPLRAAQFAHHGRFPPLQIMGRTRSPTLVPFHATRRNTACDRKAGCGSATFLKASSKKRASANWGRPGDELWDEYDFDITEPSHEEALASAAGLEWAEVDGLSDDDSQNMEELEHAMRNDWLRTQENETSDEIAREGEKFFSSLDPQSWVD